LRYNVIAIVEQTHACVTGQCYISSSYASGHYQSCGSEKSMCDGPTVENILFLKHVLN